MNGQTPPRTTPHRPSSTPSTELTTSLWKAAGATICGTTPGHASPASPVHYHSAVYLGPGTPRFQLWGTAEDPGSGLFDGEDVVAGDLELDLDGERLAGCRVIELLEMVVDRL